MKRMLSTGCRGIRWILRQRLFWVLLVLFVICWQGYVRLKPGIAFVPVVRNGAEMTIRGHGFGRHAGSVIFECDGQEIPVNDFAAWSRTEIVVSQLPEKAYAGGRVRVRKPLGFAHWTSAPRAYVVREADLPSHPYDYVLPVEAESPWPLFRRDERNSGSSPICARYNGDKPWAFTTGKGVFSTPVIGGDGTIYVGSADHAFYALRPDGTERWRFPTGGVIDSAAALHRKDPQTGASAVTFLSGDGIIYHLRTDGEAANSSDRELWQFDAASLPGQGYVNWWEGNVAVGYDGTIFAGNTNWNYYAIRPDGAVKWAYPTGSNDWSMAAFGGDGTIFWGSLDTQIRAVSPDGCEQWKKRTLGFVAASAALGSDGTVYIGSFDTYFRALDPVTGKAKWRFKTGDHIYSSAALDEDAAGNTDAIYFGSTDGCLYALDPAGRLLWKYDTGDPIRSSPALGRAPENEGGDIVYVGSSNGVLYAINAATGTRRWSFNTTPEDPALHDRNDLNGSPALGATGVYIGSESGCVWYVPYDYPLHATDSRCKTSPGEDLPENASGLFYVSPGGTTMWVPSETISAATVITFRLVVRQNGKTVDARIKSNSIVVGMGMIPPPTTLSADGHFLHVVLPAFLEDNEDHSIRIQGIYLTGGFHLGKLTFGGRESGGFVDAFEFRSSANRAARPPFAVEADHVTAFELTRLALPIPSMMPSLNQIGFDELECIISPITFTEPDDKNHGQMALWMTGARRNEQGVLVADPQSGVSAPLNGAYQGDHFILRAHDSSMAVLGLEIPFHLLDLRGQFGVESVVKPGATFYAEANVWSIPTFGPYLVFGGLASDVYKKLIVYGTYVMRPYDAKGPANRRPEGVTVTGIQYSPPMKKTAGSLVAQIALAEGASYPTAEHAAAIAVLDVEHTRAFEMNYAKNTSCTQDAQGNLKSVTLSIPPGAVLPGQSAAVVMLDAFPAFEQMLQQE